MKDIKTYYCKAFNYQPCARTKNNNAKRVLCCNMCKKLTCEDRCQNSFTKCGKSYLAFYTHFFIAVDKDNNVVGQWPSVKVAAKANNISPTTFYFYLSSKESFRGLYFKEVN